MSVKQICKAINNVLPETRPIEHHSPSFGYDEISAVSNCLDFNEAKIRNLETSLAEYCGVGQVVAVQSGTAALHLALLASGVKPGEEVIVPSLTFVATANAVIHAGAVPHFVDGVIGPNAYKLRRHFEQNTKPAPDKRGRINNVTGRAITAIIAVDLLGFPADMPKLAALAEEFNMVLIEDAAQALGSSLGNKRCGSFGHVAILSFNNNKIVTGGGGGALLTNDEWIASKAWDLATTSRVPHDWLVEHVHIAYNYRMPSMVAALITAQLKRLPEFLEAKVKLLQKYKQALENCEVDILEAKEEWQGKPNYWLVTMLLKTDFRKNRDEVFAGLHKRGVKARALFTPMHKLPMFAECPCQVNMATCEDLVSRAICLPSGVGLCEKH